MKPKLKQTPKGKQVILNLNEQTVSREYPATFKELEQLIESIWPKQLFLLQYEMNGKFINMFDENDFQEADQDDQDLQLKLTPKPNTPSSSQSMPYQFQLDYYDAFFKGNLFKCCSLSNCRACKGTGTFELTIDQKAYINEQVKKAINKKFTKLKQIYKDQYNIKLEQERDFITEHNKLIREQKLPSLTNLLSQQPHSQNTKLTSIALPSPSPAPSPVPQQQHGFQYQPSLVSGIRTPKSSFVSQSQILTKSTTGGSQILKLSAQFKDEKIASSFEPNTEAFFTVLLINNGAKEWPQNVKLILTGNDVQSQTNIQSLRPLESKQIKVTFLTPKQPNSYTYQWRLCYEDNGSQTLFGPRFTTNFTVAFSGDRKKKLVSCIKNIWDKTDYDQIEKFVEEQLVKFPEIDEQSVINHYLDHQGGHII